jgi:signal transduction histidine kinase
MLVAAILIFGTSRTISKPLIAMSASAVRIAGGFPSPDIAVKGRDEISRLAASFNYMKNRLAQIEEMRRDLIANVSHELRTPLTSIRGFIGAILDGKVKPEDQSKYLRLVHQEAQRLSGIVNDLLLLAKLQSGSLELLKTPLDLPDVVDEVVQSLKLELDGNHLQIGCEHPAGLPRIPGDRDRIKQIVLNIMANAIQYTPAGGKIAVSYAYDESMLTTSIADTGSGIPEKERELVFEKFYRLDSSRSAGGSGLGLSIVKQLVDAHGGKIAARDNPGGGTIISFSLPYAG